MKEKFPYLKIIIKIFQVLAWVWLAAGFLIFFLILVGNIDITFFGAKLESKTGWGLFSGFYYLAYGIVGFLVSNGISELLQLLISIEENTERNG